MASNGEAETTRTIGKIKISLKDVLGNGAFGRVYKGQYGGRAVAVKRVFAGRNVEREAALHMRCDAHENVLRYLWKENDDMEDTYLVLELCLGTLADFVEGRLMGVDRQRKDFLEDATKGLCHLHKLGIVHRDVKSTNILITRPESGVVKAVISDFGFSKEVTKGRKSFSVSAGWKGTLEWMAPELLTGQGEGYMRANTSVDVYSLGVVFYYVLSEGLMPFDGEDPAVILTNIKRGLKTIVPPGKDVAAWSLIELMLSVQAAYRPPIEGIIHHPFFWDKKQRLNFIEVASDHLHSSRMAAPYARICEELEAAKDSILGSLHADWGDIIQRRRPDLALVVDHLKHPPHRVGARYDMRSVTSLLRAIRNISHHYDTMPPQIQAALGIGEASPKTTVSEIFFDIFPCLLVGTWFAIGEEVCVQPALKEFYHESWVRDASNVNVKLKMRVALRACAAQLTAAANLGPPSPQVALPRFQAFPVFGSASRAPEMPLPTTSQALPGPPLYPPQCPPTATQKQPQPSSTSQPHQNNMGIFCSLPHHELHQDLRQDILDRGFFQAGSISHPMSHQSVNSPVNEFSGANGYSVLPPLKPLLRAKSFSDYLGNSIVVSSPTAGTQNRVQSAVGRSNRNHQMCVKALVPNQTVPNNSAKKLVVAAATTQPQFLGVAAANGNNARTT